MRLLKLRLESFRQHLLTEVEFSDGMTAIVGTNGSGKTTLLEAITFALYGDQRNKQETLAPYHAVAGSRPIYRVELEFELGSDRYTVQRSRNDASLTLWKPDGPTVIARQKDDTTAKCTHLLGLTLEQFRNSFCAEQGKLGFLQYGARDRQDEVARMLGLHLLKKAEERSKANASMSDAAIKAFASVQGDEVSLTATLGDAQKKAAKGAQEREHAERKHIELKAAAEPLREKRRQAERFIDLMSKVALLEADLKRSKAHKNDLAKEAESTRAETTQYEALAGDEAAYLQLKKVIEALESARDKEAKVLAQREALQIRVQELKAKLESWRKATPPATEAALKARDELDKTWTKAQEDLKRLSEEWQQARTAAESERKLCQERGRACKATLEKNRELLAAGKCPECGQAISASSFSLESQEKELAALIKEFEDRVAAVGKLEKQPEELVKAEKDSKQSEEQRTEAHRKLASVEAERASYEQEGKKLQSDLASAEKEQTLLLAAKSEFDAKVLTEAKEKQKALHESYEKRISLRAAPDRAAKAEKALNELNELVAKAEEGLEKLKSELSALPFKTQTEAQHACDQAVRAETELGSAELAITVAKEREIELQAAVKSAEAQLEQYRQNREKLQAAQKDKTLYDTVTREMRALRETLNQRIRPELEARASENLRLLTNDRYYGLTLTESFEAKLLDDGITKDVISGGEEDVVALSLRLALSEIIQEWQGRPMSLLILDEVFGSLDAERRQSVLDRLLAIKDRFRQILVISHVEEIQHIADWTICLRRNPVTKLTEVVGAEPLELPQPTQSSLDVSLV